MNVAKCTNCGRYITKKGTNYWQLWEFVKGTRDKQCVSTYCKKCRNKIKLK